MGQTGEGSGPFNLTTMRHGRTEGDKNKYEDGEQTGEQHEPRRER